MASAIKRSKKELPEMYATEALPSGDASSKDARRAGRRVETWFELSCVEWFSGLNSVLS